MTHIILMIVLAIYIILSGSEYILNGFDIDWWLIPGAVLWMIAFGLGAIGLPILFVLYLIGAL